MDLKTVIGQGPMAGLVRIVPIIHLNAVLMMSSRAPYVSELREMVNRFDRGRDTASPRVYVCRVLHGRAADMAPVLSRALPPPGREGAAPAAAEAGGREPDQHAPAGIGAPALNQPTANALLGGLAPQTGNSEDYPLGELPAPRVSIRPRRQFDTNVHSSVD